MPSRPADDLGRGAASMVAAALLFATMSACVKLTSRELPNAMVVFLRNAAGFVWLLPWLVGPHGPGLRTARLGEHVLRAVAGLASMYCFFFAISRLGLAEALLLNYSLPLYVPLVERVWFGEPTPPGIWRGLLLGLLGLCLILKPGASVFQPAALVGALSALLSAIAQVGVRGLTRSEPVRRIVFYFGTISTLIAAPPALIAWSTPRAGLWPLIAALGLSAVFGQLLMTRAYSLAPAVRVGPFMYSAVVFAAGFDWLVFDKAPDPLSWLGALCVFVACVLTLRLRAAAPAA
ncbi:MAG: DMT family transporter [Polyangiaceae bacterium]